MPIEVNLMACEVPFGDARICDLLQTFYRQHLAGNTPQIQSLGNAGGFSGARFWQVGIRGTVFCLRRWPEHGVRSLRHLLWIHGILWQARQSGCDFIPVPLAAGDGRTAVSAHGSLWQLEPWMNGVANYNQQPDPEKLAAALHGLARFHRAAAALARPGPAPSIHGRLSRISHWYGPQGTTEAFQALRICAWQHPLLGRLALPICQRFVAAADSVRGQLQQLARETWNLQPVIGDVWHDHLLFTGSRLTGLIDFGAMKIDHVALDFARLTGSLTGDPARIRVEAAARYRQIYPLSVKDLELADGYNRSAALISGMNWLQWVCLENRDVGPPESVVRRVQRIADRMETLVQNL